MISEEWDVSGRTKKSAKVGSETRVGTEREGWVGDEGWVGVEWFYLPPPQYGIEIEGEWKLTLLYSKFYTCPYIK